MNANWSEPLSREWRSFFDPWAECLPLWEVSSDWKLTTTSTSSTEYALRQSAKPIGVATYRVTKQLPKELEGQLPSPEQIEQLLDAVENGTEVQ